MRRWAIAAGDFTPLGGMDRANHALASYLARTGREVHLIAHRVSQDLEAMNGVTVHRAGRPFDSHLLGVPLLSRAAGRVARRLGADTCLLANGGNTRWAGATWIHYLHAAYEPDARAMRARIVGRAARARNRADEAGAIASARAIVCNSLRTADDVARHYQVASDRLRVVYYGIDASRFGETSDEARSSARRAAGLQAGRPHALFIGALGDRRKGFDLVFDAWSELCRDPRWDVDLVVAGTGVEAAAWETRAASRGIASRLRFLGFRADVDAVIAAADVVVHPSRYEAYGLGVHEAVCRGLPAIVAGDAGVVERLAPALRPLVLPQPLSAMDVADRLRCWRGDVEGWRARARDAGAQLRRRSWNDMAGEIAAIVESL